MATLIHYTLAIIAVINPFICTVMLSDLQINNKSELKRIAVKSMVVVWIVLIIAAIGGLSILTMFGIELDTFKVLGGVILSFIGFNMFGAKSDGGKIKNEDELIMFAASPGTIAMTITLASDSNASYIPFYLLLSLSIAVVLTLAVMLVKVSWSPSKNNHSTGYATKFMGLIVAGMGLQFTLEGIRDFFNLL